MLVHAPAADPTDAPADPAGQGLLAVDHRGGASVVTRVRATSPLRLLTPRNHGHAAWVYSSSYGGGLLDGDALTLDVRVGAGACAMLSTQSWTKVFRTRGGPGRGATSALTASVAAGGRLLMLPDPVVCFADSRYEQTQRVDLEEGAGLVLVDWLSAGRRASGERWRFARYSTRLTVRYAREPLFVDGCLLSPEQGPLGERLGRFNVLGLIVLVGGAFAGGIARAVDRARQRPIDRRAPLLVSAMPLGHAGAVVRLAADSFERASAQAREILDFVPTFLGDDPWARKW